MKKWRQRPIRELCTEIIDCVNKTAPTVDGPTPWRMIRTTNVRDGRIDLEKVRYVDEESYRKWTRRGIPKRGDIVLTREAPLGEVGMLRDDAGVFLGQRLVLYRPNFREVDPHFLLGAMRAAAVQSQIKAFGSGATVEHMRVPDCGELLVDCPPLEIQRKIGRFLSAIDDAIEIDGQRIELLENLARSLYQEWFTHLRFPGHRDHDLVESEAGTFPRGWKICSINELAVGIRGRSYRRTELSELEGVPFLNLKCVKPGGGFRQLGLKRYTGPYKETQRTSPGDVLVAVTDMTQERRIVAQAFRMPDLGEPFAIPSLDLILLKVDDQSVRSFLYLALRYSNFARQLRQFANGANVLHLSPDRILEYQLPMPNLELLERFADVVDPIFEQAEHLETRIRFFTAVRELLLPRIMTGRMDISNVDLGMLWADR